MYRPICIHSPHHISTAMNEALTQTAPTAVRQSEPKPFTTCLLHNAEKNSFLGLHRAEPSGRTGSVFRLQEHRELQKERDLEKERWAAFLRNLESRVILLSPSCGLELVIYHVCKIVYCKTGFTFVFPRVPLF